MAKKQLKTYEQDIEKMKQKLEKLQKEKKKVEEKLLIKIGKLYVELQQILDENLTIEEVVQMVENEVCDLKKNDQRTAEKSSVPNGNDSDQKVHGEQKQETA